MATTGAQLPFTRPAGGPVAASSPTEELEGAMSMARIGLFFIAALAIGIIVVAVMNIKMGAKKKPSSTSNEGDEDEGDEPQEDKSSYPNLYRDYIIVAVSSLTFLVAAASIFMSFPKKV